MAVVSSIERWLRIAYVIFAFCSAFFLGALKGLLVGPIAGLILIAGNVGVILGLFPAHVAWTISAVAKTSRFDIPLKVAILVTLPALFGIWLGLSIAGSVLVGVGYGFFTPWVSAFEAFRQDNESNKFFHCLVDGTWGTIKGSCTVVNDFADICYHSYPLYLKELRESPASDEIQTLRLIHVPGCIIVGITGLIIDIPLFTAIAVVKSPYLLVKGWFRLVQDLVNREGPFFETACIPVAGLTILLWPIIVVGFVLVSIFSSFFVGLYGSVVVYQERSFRRGIAYVIAVVAEFDEYTNDWLYLREGTVLPKPRYRKRRASYSSELSVTVHHSDVSRVNPSGSADAPAMFVPSLARSVSVREAIQEVKMVQIWEHMMGWFEMKGKELLDAGVITPADLYEFLKGNSNESAVINVGLPCYSLLHTLLSSIKAGSRGMLLLDGLEVTHMNRPQEKFLDWFFSPIMVLKDQIRVIKLGETEVRYLEKIILFGNQEQRMEAWDNRGFPPQDNLRAAQIQGISRRMMGMVRSVSKLPTYRRRFRQVVKTLITYSLEKEGYNRTGSMSSGDAIEAV
ncbi:PREDICTED: uncharacterized membrane protein At3g27390 [Tarenaya hassleriana]|uniref:uncharacterized membrane protein At3g27390 n=1 Tax=Tarenaya hassleriana TaxID=28532 RepID=UPI00053C19E3|nr:PREDICTED: uncharacterized membrane protein At3g27390 [Tarenaya hassleriana]